MMVFSNIVQNRGISRYSNNEPFIGNIKDSIMKAILKDRNHEISAKIGVVLVLLKFTKKKLNICRGKYRPFLRSVTAFGRTKIGAQILKNQLKMKY